MKRAILVILAIALLAPMVSARTIYEHVETGGTLTADGLVMSGSGYFYGIAVVTDGSNPVTVSIYDNTTNSGTKIVPDWTVTTGPTDRIQVLSFDKPIAVQDGIYVDITTAGTVSYNGYYRSQQ